MLAAGLLTRFASPSPTKAATCSRPARDLDDRASLQRGAQLYMNYCSGCHSLKYLRYSRMAEDLGLTEDEVQDNLNLTGAKFGETDRHRDDAGARAAVRSARCRRT